MNVTRFSNDRSDIGQTTFEGMLIHHTRRTGRLLRTVGLFLGLVVTGILQSGCGDSANLIVVGSKNFTEQVLLGELLAQHIETQLQLPVNRKLNLAGTFLCHEAVQSGDIDVYVEYTGTALIGILKENPVRDPQLAYETVQEAYSRQFNLVWTEPLGFNNTFAIMVRGEDARSLGLTTISETAGYAPQWRAGFGYEFLERADGFRGLAKVYGLRFLESPKEMDLGLMYRALNERQVDLIAGNSTEGLVESLDITILEDDRNYFPPYQAAPVVNRRTLEKHNRLHDALRQLGGTISDAEMRRMNYLVDGKHRDVKGVVRDFLRSLDLGIPPPKPPEKGL